MSTVVKDLGAVSAYAYAVEKGYTGTEEEFAELMADYANVGQRAEDAATTATTKASEAATSAQTATTKAGEATTAAGTATTAKNDAVAAKTAAETAQGKAEDAQAAAESVAESIPSDYSQLSEDVSDLKEGLNSKVSTVNGIAPDANGNVNVDGGGISGEAVTLLISILTAGVYTSDQSSNIEALLIALGGMPVTWEKVGKTLVFSNVDAITSITQSGTTLVCA